MKTTKSKRSTSNKKLALQRDIIRVLHAEELAGARGGTGCRPPLDGGDGGCCHPIYSA